MATQVTTQQQDDNHIAWGPLIWIGGIHLAALLAFVPAYFDW